MRALAACALLLLSVGLATRAMVAEEPVRQADRVITQVVSRDTVQLAGALPNWARARLGTAADLGEVAPETPMRVTFVLARAPGVEMAFRKLLVDQQNPQSPRYHRWLTPGQLGAAYGPTAHDVAVLTGWLASQNLMVREVAPSGVFISVTGSAAAVGAALHTPFHRFATGQTSPRTSTTQEPAIPKALQPLVETIEGLSDAPLRPLHRMSSAPVRTEPHIGADGRVRPRLTYVTGQHFLTPNDFIMAYGLYSVLHGGTTGTGQSIAILGRSRVNPQDVSLFESLTQQAATQPTVVIPPTGVDPGMTADGNQAEATLDVDRALSTAPGARVDLVVSTSGSGGIETAAQYEVQTLLDPIMSISFGSCEAEAGPAGVTYWDTLFAQAAAEGISSFAASGDGGADSCPRNDASPLVAVQSISQICASSYVTCVGGTEFADEFTGNGHFWSDTNDASGESLFGYVPEGAWNEPTTVAATGTTIYSANATGGGASLYISKPDWQLGPGVPRTARGMCRM